MWECCTEYVDREHHRVFVEAMSSRYAIIAASRVREEKCSHGGRWEECGKRNIFRTHLNGRAAWGMLRTARRDRGGWWFTAFFHAVYVVVECSRVPLLLLSPPTEPTTTIIIAINQHQHHNSRRGNNCLLSHSVSRWRSLSRRDDSSRLWPADRETFTREISSQNDIDVRWNSRELQSPLSV